MRRCLLLLLSGCFCTAFSTVPVDALSEVITPKSMCSLLQDYPRSEIERVFLFDKPVIVSEYIDDADTEAKSALSSIVDDFEGYSVRTAWVDLVSRVVLRQEQLTDDQKSELAEARAILYLENAEGSPTATYKNYLAYKKRYLDILERYGNDPTKVPDGEPQAQLKLAFDDWQAIGEKTQVETALSVVERLTVKPDDTLKLALDRTLDQLASLEDHPYEFYPMLSSLPVSASGWVTATLGGFEDGDANTACASKVFSFPALTKGAPTFAVLPPDVKLQRVELEFQFVAVHRSWYLAELAASNQWSLPDGAVMSNGNAKAPEGILPWLPVRLIVVRNVQYYFSDSGTANKTLRPLILKGSPVSVISSLSISGRYDVGDTTARFARPTPFFGGMSTSFLQVVGVVVQVVPQAPVQE